MNRPTSFGPTTLPTPHCTEPVALRRVLLLTSLALVGFALLPRAQAVTRAPAGYDARMQGQRPTETALEAALEDRTRSEPITELTIDERLSAARARRAGFVGLSFGTIAAFNANGAASASDYFNQGAYSMGPSTPALTSWSTKYSSEYAKVVKRRALRR